MPSIASAALAEEYATLERRLAADLGSDREAYTEARSDFTEAVLDRIRVL